jgi:restriction endonuclease
MKLQFKEQDFQIDAVKAVVDCFEGQPIKTNLFTLPGLGVHFVRNMHESMSFFVMPNKRLQRVKQLTLK